MVLTRRFPAAVRAIDCLSAVHNQAPDKVQMVANLLEECMQAYGRCLLSTSDSGERSLTGSVAVREAESHMEWRSRLRSAMREISTDVDAEGCRALERADREIDRLMYTVDEVLGHRDVHCAPIGSGLHS